MRENTMEEITLQGMGRVCLICGRTFEGRTNKKTCSENCRRIRIKETEVCRGKTKKRQKERKTEKDLLKENRQEIRRLTEEARASGLSYGQYVARQNLPQWNRLGK